MSSDQYHASLDRLEKDLAARTQGIHAALDTLDTEEDSLVGDLGTAAVRGIEDVGTYLGAGAKGLGIVSPEFVAEDIAEEAAERRLETPEYVQQFREEYGEAARGIEEAEGFLPTTAAIGRAAGEAFTHPKALAYEAVQMIPNMLPSLGAGAAGMAGGAFVGGPVGAAIGGLTGLFAGTMATEHGAKYVEKVQEEVARRGGNVEDADDVLGVMQDEAFNAEAHRAGLMKGAVIGGAETIVGALTGGLGARPARVATSKILGAMEDAGVNVGSRQARMAAMSDPAIRAKVEPIVNEFTSSLTTGTRARRAAAGTAIDIPMEGIGEAAGEFAAEGEINYGDALLESIIAGPSSAIMATAETMSGERIATPQGIEDFQRGLPVQIGAPDRGRGGAPLLTREMPDTRPTVQMASGVEVETLSPRDVPSTVTPEAPEPRPEVTPARTETAPGVAPGAPTPTPKPRLRMPASGTFYKDRAQAAMDARRQGLTDQYEPVQVDGGWALQQRPESVGAAPAFSPTHELPDGTPVRSTDQPNVYVDDTGAEVEDAYATPLGEGLEAAAAEADTTPTEAQKESGTYKKGHYTIDGMDISIENPAGSVRSGKDDQGREWETEMQSHYGYIRGTVGADGHRVRGPKKDHLDVFVAPGTGKQIIGDVYVVDQIDSSTGEFDEHKVMIGYGSQEEASRAYLENYEEGWQGLGAITPMAPEAFKEWSTSDATRQAVTYRQEAEGAVRIEEAGRPDEGMREQPRPEEGPGGVPAEEGRPGVRAGRPTEEETRQEDQREEVGIGEETEAAEAPAEETPAEVATPGVTGAKMEEAPGEAGVPPTPLAQPAAPGATPRPPVGMTVKAVKRAIAKPRIEYAGSRMVIKVIETNDKLPPGVKRKAWWDRARAVYDEETDSIYLVASKLESAQDARLRLAHEVVGHEAMEAIITDWPAVERTLGILEANGNEMALSLADEADSRGYAGPDRTKEILAIAVERAITKGPVGKLVMRLKVAIRKFLKAVGIGPIVKAEDIDSLILAALRQARTGKLRKDAAIDAANVMFSQVATDYSVGLDSLLEKTGGDYQDAAQRLNTATMHPATTQLYHGRGELHFMTRAAATEAGAQFAELVDGFYDPLSKTFLSREDAKKIVQWAYGKTDRARDDAMLESQELRRTRAIAEEPVVEGIEVEEISEDEAAELAEKVAMFDLPRQSSDDKQVLFALPQSKFHETNRRLREEDKTLWEKLRKELKRQLAPGGLLPSNIWKAKIDRDSQMAVHEMDIANLVAHFDDAIRRSYGTRYEKLAPTIKDQLHTALGGRIAVGLPPDVKNEILKMRDHIDGLSGEYAGMLFSEIRELQASGQDEAAAARAALLQTIVDKIGIYVHRSYRAFDDPKWFSKIPDRVFDAARRHIVGQHEARAKKYDAWAKAAEDRGDTEKADRHRNRADHIRDNMEHWADKTMERIVKTSTAYDSMEAFVREPKLGAKDLTVLMHKKDIHPTIRVLLGEYTDPRLNLAKSVTKMSRLVENQRFLDRIIEEDQALPPDQRLFHKSQEDAPIGVVKQIATSDAYKPLSGMWTYPEVEQSFRDALDKEQMADWYRAIVQANGMVKYGKTVLSPTTALRNWMSAYFFTVANGHFNLRPTKQAFKAWNEYRTNKDRGKFFKYLKDLKELGVVYDTPYASEMMRLLEESRIEDRLMAGQQFSVKQWLDIATKFYGFGDDFWKIVGFENELGLLRKRKPKMDDMERQRMAAERIRNTYPTYSMTGKFIQRLRRFPLVGTFVSFPAEIIRTTANIFWYLRRDMADPDLRPLAIRRITGIAMVSGMAYGLQETFKNILGVDDDEEEALRDLAAPWQKNSNLLPVSRDEKGNLRYFDLSFMDPYNYWKRPITAILRDQPITESVKSAARDAFEPFFGTDIAFGAIVEVLTNKKETGGQVFEPADTVPNQTTAIIDHLRKALQPGVASNIERTLKAVNGQISPSGKKYELGDEMAAFLGFRVSTHDPRVALHYKAYEFIDAKRDATGILSRVARNPNPVDDEELRDAYDRSKLVRTLAYTEMLRLVKSARISGLPPDKIRQTLRNSGVSARDTVALMGGVIPPWKPTRQFLSGMVRTAEAIYDPAIAADLRRRQQFVLGMQRQEATQ